MTRHVSRLVFFFYIEGIDNGDSLLGAEDSGKGRAGPFIIICHQIKVIITSVFVLQPLHLSVHFGFYGMLWAWLHVNQLHCACGCESSLVHANIYM